MTRQGVCILCLAVVLTLVSALTASAALSVVASFYRPDRIFHEYDVFWTYTAYNPGDPITAIREGGALCIYVRNSGAADVTISDVTINGAGITAAMGGSGGGRCGANTKSVYYTNNTTLISAGVPVWWRAMPQTISPGQISQVYVYMRYRVTGTLSVVVVPTAGGSASTNITVSSNPVPRVAGVGLSPDSSKLYLYLRHPQRGKLPTQILVDNVDVTSSCTIGADTDIDLVPVTVNLSSVWVRGSFHCFQAIYDDGTTAMDGMRMFYDDFMHAVWGEPSSVDANYVADMARHSINRFEYGTGGTTGYLDNHVDLMTQWGMYQDTDQLSIWPRTYSLFLCDEPDAGDINAPTSVAPTEADRPGCMAQDLMVKSQTWNASYPAYPTYLNVDENFKPYAWYAYAHVPDQFCCDPYYHNALADVYYSRPWKLPIYTKTTYQRAVVDTANAACEPRTLQILIATGRFQDESSVFRWLTPEEERMCAYYSVACGAKQLGYWWMTSTNRTQWGYNGIGVPDQPGTAALWREIGLIGAEFGTVGPLIQRACPASMPISATTGRLWTRALLCGTDTMILFCINDDHSNDRNGSVVRSIDDADVSFDLPAWLATPASVFEVDYGGLRDVTYSVASGRITLNLGRTDLTRMIILTSDSALRSQVQSRYDTKYSSRVNELVP